MEIITSIILISYKPIKIVAGYRHTILVSNPLYVWGRNDYGQLGLDDNENRYSPHELPLYNIKLISCGMYHTVALAENDDLYVWGKNDVGQLGLGDYINRISPRKLRVPFSKIEVPQIKSVVCGGHHTIALIEGQCPFSSKIYVWGYNESGQLGLGDFDDRNTPEELILDNVVSISCGVSHTVALTHHDTLYVWGSNCLGQLGLGDTNNRSLPQKLIFSLLGIKSVVCGRYHMIVLTVSGLFYSWGNNFYGQLGLGDKNGRNFPHKGLLSNVVSVSCGWDHTVAITTTNLVYIWGDNSYGQLGVGGHKNKILPQKLILKNNNIKTIVCGGNHTIAITNTNDVYVWGDNSHGQLGLDDETNRKLPCPLLTLVDKASSNALASEGQLKFKF